MLPSSNLASNQQNSEASGSEAPNSQAHPSTPFQAGATQPDTTQSEQAESSTMSRQNSEIYIQAAANIDFPYLAYLEYLGFANDAFSAAAFGAYRAAEDNLLKRAINMAEGPGTEGKTIWFVKAVNDRGEIVGFAAWERGRFPSGKARSGGEEMWGSGANVRLCNDTFLRGDESMGRACAGRDYQKLNVLVVNPSYQRRGIGKMLLEQGLQDARRDRFQTVVHASSTVAGLFRRYGFRDYEIMDMNLWEYGGASQVERRVIMHKTL